MLTNIQLSTINFQGPNRSPRTQKKTSLENPRNYWTDVIVKKRVGGKIDSSNFAASKAAQQNSRD